MRPTNSKTPPDIQGSSEAVDSARHRFAPLEAIHDSVSVVDEDLNIVFLNSRLKSEIGDLVGKKCRDTALGSDEICSQCPVKSDWDYSKGPFCRRARDANKRMFEFTVMKYIDLDSGRSYWISVERDITEQAETEARLKTISASFDQMAEAVCVSDLEGHLIYTNKAYVKLTGYDDKRVAGLVVTDMSRQGSSGATIQTILKAAVEHGWQGEMTGLRKDGMRYYTQVEAKPVKDERGRTLGVVGILHDVTQEKSEKVEFEKYTTQLEARMEARTTELARKVSQLTTINKISRVVTSILDLDELMSEYVKAIAQGFGYQHVIIMMLDKERGDLFMKAAFGRQQDLIPKDMRQKLKEGIIGHAAYFGETLVSGDVEADPRYLRKMLIGTKSEVAVPVTYRGELLGILDVQSDFRDAFTRNDVNILEMLADMLATSLVNARVYTESREREATLSVLDRISKQISYRLEPSVILDQVARDAATLLKAEKAMVGLVDSGKKSINWVVSYKVDKEKARSVRLSSEEGVSGRALKWLKTEVVNDYLSDPDASEKEAEAFEITSMVCAPLMVEGRGIGVINVYNKIGGKFFAKSDALFLSSLADHAAIALENANLLSSLNQRVHSQLALLETAISMQREIESSTVYELVADKIREVVWYDGITFYKIDHERQMVVPLTARGPYVDEIMADYFPIGEGITGSVAKTGKPELVNDTLKDSRAVSIAGTPEDEEAMISIPLMGKEKVIGVLTLYRDGEGKFSDQDFEIAQLFASQAAVAVENASLYRATESLLGDSKKKVEQMAKVLELTTSVMYMGDLEKLLQRMCDAVVQSFGFRRASIGIFDQDSEAFVIKAMAGYPSWVTKEAKRPAHAVFEDMDEKFRTGAMSYYVKYEQQKYDIDAFQFLAHPELANKPRGSPDAWHERDILMSAFRDRSGKLTGYILVDEPNDLKVPSKDQIELLEILAGIGSIAVENSKTYERQVLAANEIALLNDLMTHDINNFNQGIMGYIELLLQDKRLDDSQRKYAERALMQVKNNARLIDNIRKLAKVRMISGDDFVATDLCVPVAEAAESVTKSTLDKKVVITSAIPEGVHYVMANQHINDLFLNVISNAVKFDSSKRVRVDMLISDEKTSQGEFWVVSVVDRGRGIPDDRKKAVFERFATGMTGVKGFGLGLSIVGSIVERFGGRIWVEDRVKGDSSKGTVFKIMLPKAKAPEESATSSSSESTPEPPSQGRSAAERASQA